VPLIDHIDGTAYKHNLHVTSPAHAGSAKVVMDPQIRMLLQQHLEFAKSFGHRSRIGQIAAPLIEHTERALDSNSPTNKVKTTEHQP
jgi:hypothetical protein